MGLFDGVHLGHRAVIEKAKSLGDAAVFTFDTQTVTTKGSGFRYILSREEKLSRIKALGAEKVFSYDFGELKTLSAEDTVRDILCKKLGARYVVCGEDFRFGRGAEGNAQTLSELCRSFGAEAVTVPKVSAEDGRKISSADIRRLISSGNMTEANALLGYDYFFDLPVEKGKMLGRTLGFPTINQSFEQGRVLPRFGVYASYVTLGDKLYKSITNIGTKPTVSQSCSVSAETYIIGFSGSLYGENVTVSLRGFIRPEKKFDSVSSLKAQIKEDIGRECFI